MPISTITLGLDIIDLAMPLIGRFRIEKTKIQEIEFFEGLISGVIIRQDIHPRNSYFFRLGGGAQIKNALRQFQLPFTNYQGLWWIDTKARNDWKRWKELQNERH